MKEYPILGADIEDKIKESEELLKATSKKQPLMELMASKSKYRSLFDGEEKEFFVSYEDSKREKEGSRKEQDPYRMVTPKERE